MALLSIDFDFLSFLEVLPIFSLVSSVLSSDRLTESGLHHLLQPEPVDHQGRALYLQQSLFFETRE